MNADPRTATNPWMVALTIWWGLVLAVAIVLAVLGRNADSLSYDQVGLPPSHVLAGIYYACSGVAAAAALVIIGVQIAVGALRWYLDPGARALAPEHVSEHPVSGRSDQ